MNDYITQYLDMYCRSEDVDYAIMISGKWGSGKTFFIHKYLEHYKEEFKKADRDLKAAYVSLNGVQSKSEINLCIFQQMHPALNKKGLKTGGKIIASLLGGCTVSVGDAQVGLGGIGNVLSEAIPSGKIDLLVLDDIERCAMSAEVLLGEVAGFLDCGNHVIMIGEEKQFSKKMNAGTHIKYEEVKEKVVGKTFAIAPSLELIYEDLIKSFKGKEVFDVLNVCKDGIIEDFNAVKEHGNYRALKAAMRELGFWLDKFPDAAKKNEEFVKSFVHIFISLCYEHQLGLLTAENFGQTRSREAEEAEYEKVLARHKIQNNIFSSINSLLLPDEIMREMIFSQPVEMQELQNAILALPFFESSEDNPTWTRLWNFYTLEDDEIRVLVKKIKHELSERKYVRPEEILMIFTILADMSELQLIPETVEMVQTKASKYAEKIAKKGELADPIKEEYEMFDTGFGGYAYPGEYNGKPWFTKIRKSIIDILKNNKCRKNKKWVCNASGTLGDWNGIFYTRLKTDTRIYNSPIFLNVPSKRFLEGFKRMPNIDKRSMGAWLQSRFSRLENSVKETEKPFWTSVANRIAHLLDQRKTDKRTVSTIQLMVLRNLLNTQYDLDLPQYKFRQNSEQK